MMLRIFLFLALFPSRALAFSWRFDFNIYSYPVSGFGGGPGNNLLIQLASDWFAFLSNVVIGLCLIAIVWGASTMQGVATDEGNKENGKKIIIGALIGLVLAILAKGIVDFADSFIDANNFPACNSSSNDPGCQF